MVTAPNKQRDIFPTVCGLSLLEKHLNMEILQTPGIFVTLITTVVCSAQGPSAQKQDTGVSGFLAQEIQVSSESDCSLRYVLHFMYFEN